MSNQEYYKRWLELKKDIQSSLVKDEKLQRLAVQKIGIAPQNVAVEMIGRVYCKYCDIYNRLCECYDQMEQVQRRFYIKQLIDAITCRILELKSSLEEVEAFEFTYVDNALQQLLMIPQHVEIICPFFYPFEIRQKEMQYIIDEIFSGKRIGDPTPTPSEIERQEEERLAEELRIQEEKDAEIKRKLALGEEIIEEEVVVLSPQEIEEQRLLAIYNEHINNIQRMERARVVTRENAHKAYTNANLYLELAGTKAPLAREHIRKRAAELIKRICKRFLELKREHNREDILRVKLGMIYPSWKPPSEKVQLEKVKEVRREFRRKYYDQWLAENVKEKARVLRLREGDIMEDISGEIRQWFQEWYNEARCFDEYPWPDEGGTILVVRGETFTVPEYIEWRDAEVKRLKAEAGSPKSKEQIKAEKLLEREEKKRLAAEAKEREKKALADYKKSRLNPDNDPGIYLTVGHFADSYKETWEHFENQWHAIDVPGPEAQLHVIQGYMKLLITENVYSDLQFQLRPIVDEMMRIELTMLKNSLKIDCQQQEIAEPLTKKRKKPKKQKPPKKERITPERMFQQLADACIVRKYPRITLDEFWGERNYAAADLRAIPWVPSFPPHCIGDIREQVRVRCILALGSNCQNADRAQLIVGPKSAGKRTLIYAIATETNALLIDLSPMNVYNKFPAKKIKTMYTYVNKISRMMQPTVILVDEADKLFYKKVPKEEKQFDPTRLQKDFFKEFIKPLTANDKILILGTASMPWLSKAPLMYKAFPTVLMLPRSDYATISFILTKMLMDYHGVKRNINVHSLAQALRGYNIYSIVNGLQNLLHGNRIPELYHKPLEPMEVLNAVLDVEGPTYMDQFDYNLYKEWYLSYSAWGEKYRDLMTMLDSQLQYKLKKEKKKNKP